jgi:hypothetical protein
VLEQPFAHAQCRADKLHAEPVHDPLGGKLTPWLPRNGTRA